LRVLCNRAHTKSEAATTPKHWSDRYYPKSTEWLQPHNDLGCADCDDPGVVASGCGDSGVIAGRRLRSGCNLQNHGITAKCGDNGEIAKMRKTGDWGNQTFAAAENTGLLRKTKVMVKFAKVKKLRIRDKTLCIAVT